MKKMKKMKNTIRLSEADLKKVISESVKKVLNEDMDVNSDLATLETIVDELRKLYDTTLRHYTPFMAFRLKKSGVVDEKTIDIVAQITNLTYALGNQDFSHKRAYNGQTFNDRWERAQYDAD